MKVLRGIAIAGLCLASMTCGCGICEDLGLIKRKETPSLFDREAFNMGPKGTIQREYEMPLRIEDYPPIFTKNYPQRRIGNKRVLSRAEKRRD